MGAVIGQTVHCFYRNRDVIVDSVVGEYWLGRYASGVGRAAPSIVVNGMALVRLVLDTRKQVATRYGVSPGTVSLWRRAVEGLRIDSDNWSSRNVKPRGKTESILADMPQMTAKELAKKYEMSQSAVYQLSRKWNVKPKSERKPSGKKKRPSPKSDQGITQQK